jgi:ribosomal-protein-alanine N-acetyltransferase
MDEKALFAAFPRIEGGEISLRKIEKADLDGFWELMSDPVLYRYKPGEPKKTLEAAAHVIGHYERDFARKLTIILGIFLPDGQLAGTFEVFDADPKVGQVTVGYTLRERFQGRGIATKATALMLGYLFEKIGVNRVQAFVMPENVKSQNVLARCGFTREGTIRQGQFWRGRGVVDLMLYAILKREYEKIMRP